jgi:hypothetical protein
MSETEKKEENKRKRKVITTQKSNPAITPSKRRMMNEDAISPTSKIQVFKIDVIACNGQPIDQTTELGAVDLEDLWTLTIGRALDELSGYSSNKKNKEIRIQFQLKKPMSIREITHEQEFNHERSTTVKTDIFRCRVVGLAEVRQAVIGETVKVTVAQPNFDISVEQILEWLSKFGDIKEGHRYLFRTVSKL